MNINQSNPGTLVFTTPEGETELYKVVQFHFHAPSEHTFRGKRYDAELHIVHSEFYHHDKLVLSILFDASKDLTSPFLDKLGLTSIPQWNTTNPKGGTFGSSLKPPLMEYVERMGQSFYHYTGSFTTPPCTEGVKFLVMSEVQYITLADMATF